MKKVKISNVRKHELAALKAEWYDDRAFASNTLR